MDFIHSPPTPDSSQPHIADEVREEIISRYYDLMVAATIPVVQAHWCRLMNEEVMRRSPERVREMEKLAGLPVT